MLVGSQQAVVPELVFKIDEVEDTALERGIVGDRQGGGSGAKLARELRT